MDTGPLAGPPVNSPPLPRASDAPLRPRKTRSSSSAMEGGAPVAAPSAIFASAIDAHLNVLDATSVAPAVIRSRRSPRLSTAADAVAPEMASCAASLVRHDNEAAPSASRAELPSHCAPAGTLGGARCLRSALRQTEMPLVGEQANVAKLLADVPEADVECLAASAAESAAAKEAADDAAPEEPQHQAVAAAGAELRVNARTRIKPYLRSATTVVAAVAPQESTASTARCAEARERLSQLEAKTAALLSPPAFSAPRNAPTSGQSSSPLELAHGDAWPHQVVEAASRKRGSSEPSEYGVGSSHHDGAAPLEQTSAAPWVVQTPPSPPPAVAPSSALDASGESELAHQALAMPRTLTERSFRGATALAIESGVAGHDVEARMDEADPGACDDPETHMVVILLAHAVEPTLFNGVDSGPAWIAQGTTCEAPATEASVACGMPHDHFTPSVAEPAPAAKAAVADESPPQAASFSFPPKQAALKMGCPDARAITEPANGLTSEPHSVESLAEHTMSEAEPSRAVVLQPYVGLARRSVLTDSQYALPSPVRRALATPGRAKKRVLSAPASSNLPDKRHIGSYRLSRGHAAAASAATLRSAAGKAGQHAATVGPGSAVADANPALRAVKPAAAPAKAEATTEAKAMQPHGSEMETIKRLVPAEDALETEAATSKAAATLDMGSEAVALATTSDKRESMAVAASQPMPKAAEKSLRSREYVTAEVAMAGLSAEISAGGVQLAASAKAAVEVAMAEGEEEAKNEAVEAAAAAATVAAAKAVAEAGGMAAEVAADAAEARAAAEAARPMAEAAAAAAEASAARAAEATVAAQAAAAEAAAAVAAGKASAAAEAVAAVVDAAAQEKVAEAAAAAKAAAAPEAGEQAAVDDAVAKTASAQPTAVGAAEEVTVADNTAEQGTAPGLEVSSWDPPCGWSHEIKGASSCDAQVVGLNPSQASCLNTSREVFNNSTQPSSCSNWAECAAPDPPQPRPKRKPSVSWASEESLCTVRFYVPQPPEPASCAGALHMHGCVDNCSGEPSDDSTSPDVWPHIGLGARCSADDGLEDRRRQRKRRHGDSGVSSPPLRRGVKGQLCAHRPTHRSDSDDDRSPIDSVAARAADGWTTSSEDVSPDHVNSSLELQANMQLRWRNRGAAPRHMPRATLLLTLLHDADHRNRGASIRLAPLLASSDVATGSPPLPQRSSRGHLMVSMHM